MPTGRQRRRGGAACRLAMAALTVVFGIPLPASAETDITFATEGTYPPWNEIEADGELAGFDIDLVHALCTRLGAACAIETAAFPAMVDEVAAGVFDAIISGIAITAEREALIAFTRPYMSLSISFAAASGSPLAQNPPASVGDTLSRLAGARLGAQIGTVNAELIARDLPDAQLVPFDNQELLDAAVVNLDVDAGLAATETWKDFAPGAITTLGPPLTSAEYPVLGRGLGIGLAKSEAALKEALDEAICALTADETIAEISIKWFETDLSVPCP